jgi:hypothetical protein
MPGREPLLHRLAVVICFKKVMWWAEVDVKGFEYGQKALGMARGLEALEYPFSSSGPLVRVLSAVVQIAALSMFGVGQ